jgi:hypothetical protein
MGDPSEKYYVPPEVPISRYYVTQKDEISSSRRACDVCPKEAAVEYILENDAGGDIQYAYRCGEHESNDDGIENDWRKYK